MRKEEMGDGRVRKDGMGGGRVRKEGMELRCGSRMTRPCSETG